MCERTAITDPIPERLTLALRAAVSIFALGFIGFHACRRVTALTLESEG
jgi:hypothetical protein